MSDRLITLITMSIAFVVFVVVGFVSFQLEEWRQHRLTDKMAAKVSLDCK